MKKVDQPCQESIVELLEDEKKSIVSKVKVEYEDKYLTVDTISQVFQACAKFAGPLFRALDTQHKQGKPLSI